MSFSMFLIQQCQMSSGPHGPIFFRDTISSNFGGSQRGAILTTHYMEEAAALCDRVAIMVNGQMQ